MPALGIPWLLELLHAPPEPAATATAALQANKSSLKSCKSLTTTTTLESMSISNAMQSAVVSATDEAPSPHCTASRKQERKEGHATWRQIATLVEGEDHHVGDDSSIRQIMIVKRKFHYFFIYFIVLLFPTMRRVSTACIRGVSNKVLK